MQIQALYKTCTKRVCKEKECTFRHPNLCKNGENCKFFRINGCLYKHVKEEGPQPCSISAIENKIKEYEDKIVELGPEIDDLKNVLKTRENIIDKT